MLTHRTAQNIPFFQFVVGIVVLLVDGEYPWLLSQLGFYVSWLYLRFYQKRQVNTISSAEFIGDSSDSFALEMWFPEPVRSASLSNCLLLVPHWLA